jgi:predicted ATPase
VTRQEHLFRFDEKSKGPSRRELLRVTHLRLENWKNFGRVDVDLHRRVFLVGPNASGKSNLLDAFRFLRDLASQGGGLNFAVMRKRTDVSAIRALSARRYSDVVVAVTLGSNGEPSLWEYEVALNQDNRQRPVVRREIVRRKSEVVLERPRSEDEQDSELLTQTHLEQVTSNREFRPVAEFFSSVRYLHIVPQLVREPERSVGRTNDPYGGDFLEQIARTTTKTREARLRRITEALTVAVPQLSELQLKKDEAGVPHLRGRYAHWRPQGAWQDEAQLSDGTLRLLGLLWSLLGGRGPLLLEEPELSLHAEVIRYLPQMLARMQRRTGRQILISTHSPDLLRDRGIQANEVLLLEPKGEGTSVRPASSYKDVQTLLAAGASLADAIIPKTRPENADQLALFEGVR